MAISRGAFKNRGTGYTDKGVMMRCVRADQSSVTMTLHYMHNGSAMFRVSFLGNMYSRRARAARVPGLLFVYRKSAFAHNLTW
jgi:hypothetical protein